MKQDKYKYSIGDYVVVYFCMMRVERDCKIEWEKLFPYRDPRIGQIVGLCTRYDGEIKSDKWCNWLAVSKSHRFWLVKFGLSNKPVCVSEGGMELAKINEVIDLPYSYPPSSMTNRDKKNLSEDSKNWPRDEKGRWTKGPMV